MVSNVNGGKLGWWLAGLAAIALTGCGGNGSSDVIVPPPGSDRSRPTIRLGNAATVQTVFLSGSGRRAVGSQVAGVRVIRYTDNEGTIIPDGEQDLSNEYRVVLDGYTMNTAKFGVDFSTGQSIRTFNKYPMEIARMYVVQSNGDLSPLTDEDEIAYTPPVPFDVSLVAAPGRISTMTVRLNDSILSFSSTLGAPIFNFDAFVSANYDVTSGAMNSSFSDYLSFDISNMAAGARPNLTVSGDPAERVYYSGDGIGMSVGLGENSQYELLEPVRIVSGKVSTGPLIGPGGDQVNGSNLFILEEEDPGATKVTSLIGTWKNFSEGVVPADATTVLALPSSRETADPNDKETQQFLIFTSNSSGQISNMWQGQVFYNPDGEDPTKGTFRLFPIETIDNAIPTSTVTGTVSNLTIVNGVVRGGDWDVTSATPAGWTFPLKGGFAVYRR